MTNGTADDAIRVQMREQVRDRGARHNNNNFIAAVVQLLLVVVMLKRLLAQIQSLLPRNMEQLRITRSCWQLLPARIQPGHDAAGALHALKAQNDTRGSGHIPGADRAAQALGYCHLWRG